MSFEPNAVTDHGLLRALRARHGARLRGRALEAGRPPAARRVGARRPPLRHRDHLVPARRRPLHRLHVHRGAGARVRRRRGRLLRAALHDHRVPAGVPRDAEAVVGGLEAPVRDGGRLREGALRQSPPGDRHRVHRPARDDALHRAAARRHRGRDRRARHRRRSPAADHRVRDPRRVHVHERPARAGDDRARQGHADLRDGDRGGDLHPVQARRVRQHLQLGRAGAARA